MTNRITFTIIAASLFLAACSQDDTMPRETLPGEKQAVLFSAGGTATTRTEVGTNDDRTLSIAWAEADEVGIYGRNDGRSSGDNYAYTATPYKSDATRCSFSASDSYELFTWTKTAAQSYYAYYPYAKITDRTPNPEAHPFSLPALQTQSEGNSPAHIARYGLMTAAPVDIPAGTVGEGAILFNFANVFSIVELRFKMTADCALASVPVKQVRLLSDAAALAIPAGTIDLTRAIDPEAELPIVIGEGGGFAEPRADLRHEPRRHEDGLCQRLPGGGTRNPSGRYAPPRSDGHRQFDLRLHHPRTGRAAPEPPLHQVL